MIVLDASTLIAHLEASDAHHDKAVQVLLSHAGEGFAASPITLAEVLVGPARVGRMEQADQLLASLGVTAVALPGDAAPRLALLRVETGLKMPDCCVILAAEVVNGGLATFDERLAAVATARAIRVHGQP